MAIGPEQTAGTDRLGFLLARHGQIMNLRLRHALGVTGLGPRHAATLVRLAHFGRTSQQDLMEALALDPSALVVILNDLERDGFALRLRDPADRRRHIVMITEAGERTVCAVEGAIIEVEQDTFAPLSPDEVNQLHALLGRLRTHPVDDDGACG